MRRPANPARSSVSIRVLFLALGAAIAAFFPFLALVLKDHGLDAQQIGVAIGAMAVARIVANPLWGHMADARIGRVRAMQLNAAASAAAALVLFASGSAPMAVIVASALFAAASGSFGSMGDAIALAHLGDARVGEYGRVRGWMSAGYAAMNVVLGVVLEATGPNWALLAYAAASVFAAAWLRTMPLDEPQHARGERFGSVGAVFRGARRLPAYLLGWLLIGVAFTAAWSFLSLRIDARGGGPLLVGLGAAFGGAVEVPTFRLASRLMQRRGVRITFGLGCLVYAIGFVLWGIVTSPVLLSLLFPLEGVGFALLFASGVVIVGRLVPAQVHATGQAISGLTWMGLAPILGGPLGGWIFGTLGAVALYAGASALCLVGGAVVWLTLSGPAFSSPLDRRQVDEVAVPTSAEV